MSTEKLDRKTRKSLLAGTMGTVVEYYDFTVYAYLAIVMSPQFFPSDDPGASLMASLAVFGVAYIMRPLGGIFFGRIGDRFGRKRSLFISVALMGVSTTLMAFLPTYASVGVLAPILLVTARLMQGFSAGGELGGAMTYMYEVVGKERKGLMGTIVTIGTNGGFALAALVVAITGSILTDPQMSSWGWRVPFLLGVPLLGFTLWLRARIEDTDDFKQVAKEKAVVKSPLSEVLRTHPKATLQAFGVALAQFGVAYMMYTYLGIHLVKVGGFAPSSVAWLTAGLIATVAITMPLTGGLIDRFGSRWVVAGGLTLIAVLSYPAMVMMSGHGFGIAALGYILFIIGVPMVQSGVAALSPSLFPAKVRLTGVNVGINLASVITGGTAALISTWLVQSTGNTESPALYTIFLCFIGIAVLATMWKTVDRQDTRPVEQASAESTRSTI